MIQLRPYQEAAVDEIRGHFRQGRKRVILALPTGAGKTVVFSYLAQATLARNLFSRVVIFTNRIELLTQAGGTLAKFGITYEPISAKSRHINTMARCYVAMVETFVRRVKHYPHLLDGTLYIIDEAHYGNFKKLFSLLGDKPHIIGVTATPISANKKDPLSNYYQALVNGVQISELIDEGFLSPAVTFSAKVDRSGLKTQMGEYTEASQMAMLDKREVYAGLVDRYREVCDRYNEGRPMRTICFNVNVKHSLTVTNEFNEAGFTARHLDGETEPAKRADILADYKAGKFDILCNVGILNAGFDDPATSCIIMNRATTSVPLWLQSCGRGSRIFPGKERFVILDMAENWRDLDLWEAERDWEALYSRKKRDTKAGAAPVKDCDACGALMPIQAKVCTECGTPFPVKEKEPPKIAEFAEVKREGQVFPDEVVKELSKFDRPALWPSLSVEQLEQLRIWKNRKPGWPIHVIREGSPDEDAFRERLEELAKLRGYKRSWVQHQSYQLPTSNYA